MADVNDAGTMNELRDELNKLRTQLSDMVKSMENKKGAEVSEVLDRLSKEVSSLRAQAGERAQKLYDAGQAGVEEVGEHVRQNPLASLLVAFGAGCILSCLIRHLSK